MKMQNYVLSPEQAFDPVNFRSAILQKEGLPDTSDIHVVLLRRSIDARSRQVKVNVQVGIYEKETPAPLSTFEKNYQDVSKAPQAIVVGAGPAGLFAALRLIELGVKPIVLERGKDVRARRRDLAAINKDHVVHPDSNYCFGEGGAGTYSDGKLYTRSKKRGDIRRVLEILVAHGTREEILIDAHPHIGTNKLPQIVANLREGILAAGGEVHFETRVEDLLIQFDEIKGVKDQHGNAWEGIGVILATGHSARDIFELLHRKQVLIEAKPFALGVRVEHQQSLIDSVQYHTSERGPWLPASSYSLVAQTQLDGKERGVYSFCMCPGGFIVPSATAPGELVVNGMSPSRRDSRFANSGIVVGVELEDLKDYHQYGALGALRFQQEVEQSAWLHGGKTQVAPAQRLQDFVNKKVSNTLLDTSYQPGLQSADMYEVLPARISQRLKQGFIQFGKKMRGYLSNDAQIIGTESRTSSPVRIPRDRESLEHLQISRLYPCGEGGGFAGGIMSAAMDGERCAEALVARYKV